MFDTSQQVESLQKFVPTPDEAAALRRKGYLDRKSMDKKVEESGMLLPLGPCEKFFVECMLAERRMEDKLRVYNFKLTFEEKRVSLLEDLKVGVAYPSQEL